MVQKGYHARSVVNLNDVIASVLRLVHSDALERHCALVTEADPKLSLVLGDQVQLQQVLLNLIINAVEAMGGVSEGARELLISTGKVDSGGVLVAVRDSGPGLAPAVLEHLFDPFYTTKSNGFGRKSMAPRFIAWIPIGISPCPVIKTICSILPPSSNCLWRVRPSSPGNRTSNTRQAGPRWGAFARYSAALANVSTV